MLDANREVMKALKPGVQWDDLHLLAERVILQHLQDLGVLKKEYTIKEIQEERIGALFFPHGLGHFIGLAVHDVSGYGKCCPPRLTQDGLNKLRTRRVMEANMCVTVEPGCYFIKFILDNVRKEARGKYIDWTICDQYKEFGGVRIEDDLYITEDGCFNMSHDLPRTVEEIELCMAGQVWK